MQLMLLSGRKTLGRFLRAYAAELSYAAFAVVSGAALWNSLLGRVS